MVFNHTSLAFSLLTFWITEGCLALGPVFVAGESKNPVLLCLLLH